MALKRSAYIILISILFFSSAVATKTMIAQEAPARVDSSELSRTVITSYLREAIPAQKNLLYCSTFQIAWDRLCDDVIGGPLRLNGDPAAAAMLNERLTGENDIRAGCYLAMAGYNRDDIVGKIVNAMKERFGEKPGLDLRLENPDDILAYAFLLKDLKFDREFESLDTPLMFDGSVPVRAFGIKEFAFSEDHRKLSGQLDILDYQSDDDFIIRLKSVSPEDEIILAKIAPLSSLLETVEYVSLRTGDNVPSSIRKGERLNIPKLDFDILHFFKDLMGRQFLNSGFEKYSISQAVQSVRFRLNEKGALLRSEAAIIAPTMVPVDPPRIRNFVFNKPFLVILKEKGAKYPYFALWVDNAELLLKEK